MKKELLKIDKNVENPDTHLKHDGDIQIDADVLKGATVEATGSIIADNAFGVQLIAGGDIQIRSDVSSYKNNESVIYSKGRFYADRVSESSVIAEKSATINIVENSRIISNDDIFINLWVHSSKISSLKTVSVAKVGSGDKPTVIESGRSVIIDEKIASLFKEKTTLLARLDNINRYLLKIDNAEKKEHLRQKYDSLKELIDGINNNISNNAVFVQENAVFGITVKESAEAGTKLIMKTAMLELENTITSSLFTFKDDEIIVSNFEEGS
jgi:hypothetical protein